MWSDSEDLCLPIYATLRNAESEALAVEAPVTCGAVLVPEGKLVAGKEGERLARRHPAAH